MSEPPNPPLANHLGGVHAITELAPVELVGRLRAPVEVVVRDAAGTVVSVTELHVVYVPVPSTTHG